MELTHMLLTSTILFALAAGGGVLMAMIRFNREQTPPSWLAMLHGFLAAAALTLLVYAALTVSVPPLAKLATWLFLLAAVGGVVLNLYYHLHSLPLPKWLIAAHGAVAVVGFLLLVVATWQQSNV
jgi:high-affinity Fe2+/Pb2+ permease